MPYSNPQEVIKVICKCCGRDFKAPRYYNKEYCSVTCRRRYKAQRAVARDRESGIITRVAEQKLDDRFFVVSNNPSTIELDKYAELTSSGLTKDKPIRLTGTMPFWTPPNDIMIVEQQGIEPKEWIMVKKEKSIFDLLAMSGEPPH